jgi:hypothetical protein
MRENGGMVVEIMMMMTTTIKEPFIFMLEVEARSSSLQAFISAHSNA